MSKNIKAPVGDKKSGKPQQFPIPSEVNAKLAGNQPRSGKTVSVGCKLPGGLILQLYRPEKVAEPVMGGGTRDVTRQMPVGRQVRVYGTAKNPNPEIDHPCLVVGGYAITNGVDEDFIREWMKQNAALEVVTNGLIFVREDEQEAKAQAKDQEDFRSGLEPLARKPGDEPRVARQRNPNLTEIEETTADAA